MRFDLMYESFFKIIQGIPLTLEVVFLSTIFGLFFAIIIALMRVSENKLLSNPAYYFIYVNRGTPLLLQLFFIYYGLAQFTFIRESFLWFFLEDPLFCGILTLTLSTAAYSAEIIRGGMQSVAPGLIEAASSMGMSKMQRLRKIILPITIRRALPAFGNVRILMVKATSLISIVTLMEITGIARTIISKTYAPVEIFIVAGSIYLLINFLITRLIKFSENKLNHGTIQ